MPRERVHHGRLLIGPALDPKTGEPRRVQMQNAEGTVGEMVTVGVERSGQEYKPGVTESLSDDERIYEQPSLDVTWNRDAGWVQIGLMAPPEWFRQALESSSWVDADGKTQWPVETGVFTEVLTRNEINHMIKTLRRARDAAFGADE